jgi:hypothetical protein
MSERLNRKFTYRGMLQAVFANELIHRMYEEDVVAIQNGKSHTDNTLNFWMKSGDGRVSKTNFNSLEKYYASELKKGFDDRLSDEKKEILNKQLERMSR